MYGPSSDSNAVSKPNQIYVCINEVGTNRSYSQEGYRYMYILIPALGLLMPRQEHLMVVSQYLLIYQ